MSLFHKFDELYEGYWNLRTTSSMQQVDETKVNKRMLRWPFIYQMTVLPS